MSARHLRRLQEQLASKANEPEAAASTEQEETEEEETEEEAGGGEKPFNPFDLLDDSGAEEEEESDEVCLHVWRQLQKRAGHAFVCLGACKGRASPHWW